MGVQINGSEGNVIATKGTFSGDVGIGGTLTYEDVTNIDSVGLITARSGIEIGAGPGVAASISVDGNMIVSGISTFGGDIQVPDKIIHAGDTNTALRFPAGDVISAETNGAERLRITSAGTLLLGTSTGALANGNGIVIADATAARLSLKDTTNGVTGTDGFDVVQTGTDAYLYHRENGNMIFGTNATERLRIDSSGRLLLGTTTLGYEEGDDLNIASATHCGITIRSGTTSSIGNIYFADGTSGDSQYRGIVQYHHSGDSMRIYTAATERIRIDSSGHMGLGVTPNGNWPTNADYKALQIGTGACVFGRGSGDEDRGGIAVNYYHTGSAEKYLANGNASGMLLNDGDVDFFVAGANSSGADAAMSKTLAMRIAADADIGIGTLDPEGRLHIMGGNLSGAGSVTANTDANLLVLESNQSGGMSFVNANDERATIRFATTGTGGHNEASISYAHEAVSTTGDRRRIFFRTGGNGLRMSIGNSGSHAQIFMNCDESFSNAMFSLQTNGSSGIGIKAGATNQQFMISFRNPNGEVGTINTSGSTTSYNTSSDYRLKENAVAISDGISRLKTLKPYRFNFKTDASTTVDGFFAHEVTAVPEAITGTKDEVDSDNNPIYQGIDQSKIVPLLVAAVKELITKVEALEAA